MSNPILGSFTLPYKRPPEGLSANDRVFWAVKAQSTNAVRQVVTAKAQRWRKCQRVRVDVVWVVADQRRRDADNAAPFLKAIYDGLGADRGVSAHLVPDDDPDHMEKPGLTFRYEKGATPHFVVTVTEVGA